MVAQDARKALEDENKLLNEWNRRRQPVPQAHAGCYISAGFATLIGDLLGKSDADFDGAVNDEVKRLEKMRDSLAGDSGTSAEFYKRAIGDDIQGTKDLL
jgi:hypothetical protein